MPIITKAAVIGRSKVSKVTGPLPLKQTSLRRRIYAQAHSNCRVHFATSRVGILSIFCTEKKRNIVY